MGAPLIVAGLDWLKKHDSGINTVKAEILVDNVASQKAFHAAGFSEQRRLLVHKV
jgi:RimJ/RimL family protein N-acetyltransferase